METTISVNKCTVCSCVQYSPNKWKPQLCSQCSHRHILPVQTPQPIPAANDSRSSSPQPNSTNRALSRRSSIILTTAAMEALQKSQASSSKTMTPRSSSVPLESKRNSLRIPKINQQDSKSHPNIPSEKTEERRERTLQEIHPSLSLTEIIIAAASQVASQNQSETLSKEVAEKMELFKLNILNSFEDMKKEVIQLEKREGATPLQEENAKLILQLKEVNATALQLSERNGVLLREIAELTQRNDAANLELLEIKNQNMHLQLQKQDNSQRISYLEIESKTLKENLKTMELQLEDLKKAVEAAHKEKRQLQDQVSKEWSRAQEANKAMNTLLDQQQCVVCMENPRTMVFVPCGHKALCTQCAKRPMLSCIVCRKASSMVIRIYDM